MQTFLPYKSFVSSAKVLDRQRLGKQRVECLQIMTALVDKTGWVNHPATNMWRGYEWALLSYAMVIIEEWIRRGYKDNCADRIQEVYDRGVREGIIISTPRVPPWLGLKKFHSAHRANLLRKDWIWYHKFHWKEKAASVDDGYWWPTHHGY